MSDEKGETVTTPSGQFEYLLGEGGRGSIIVSSSKPIPTTDEIQPPHFQTFNRYKKAAEDLDGDICVTMEHPTILSPERVMIDVGHKGVMLRKVSASAAVMVTSQVSPRMG